MHNFVIRGIIRIDFYYEKYFYQARSRISETLVSAKGQADVQVLSDLFGVCRFGSREVRFCEGLFKGDLADLKM